MSGMSKRNLFATVLLFVAAAASPAARQAAAADQEFVGVLALAIEKDVAAQLQLTEDQKKKLLDVIERREGDVLDIALKLRGAPLAEREAALAPFRRESEAAGLKILDDKQRA